MSHRFPRPGSQIYEKFLLFENYSYRMDFRPETIKASGVVRVSRRTISPVVWPVRIGSVFANCVFWWGTGKKLSTIFPALGAGEFCISGQVAAVAKSHFLHWNDEGLQDEDSRSHWDHAFSRNRCFCVSCGHHGNPWLPEPPPRRLPAGTGGEPGDTALHIRNHSFSTKVG